MGESPAGLLASLCLCGELPGHNHRFAILDPIVGSKLNLLPGLRYEREDLVGDSLDAMMGTAVEEPIHLWLNPFDFRVKSSDDRLDIPAPKGLVDALNGLQVTHAGHL